MIFVLFEILLGFTILVIGISQIVLPLTKGRLIFPILRKQRNIEKAIAVKRQELYELELTKNLEELH